MVSKAWRRGDITVMQRGTGLMAPSMATFLTGMTRTAASAIGPTMSTVITDHRDPEVTAAVGVHRADDTTTAVATVGYVIEAPSAIPTDAIEIRIITTIASRTEHGTELAVPGRFTIS